MKPRRLLSLCLAGMLALSATGCVNQHPEQNTDDGSDQVRIVATSPAAVDICDKLELDLVGVCSSTLSTIHERYQDVTTVGTAMSPDLEILKSLNPDYVISPNSLQSDLQPKYASIGVSSLFLNLRSVE